MTLSFQHPFFLGTLESGSSLYITCFTVLQAALQKLLCGESERLDVPRLRMLLEAFSAYTMDARSEGSPGAMQRQGRSSAGIWGNAVIDKGKKQVLKAVFAQRGTFVQVSPIPSLSPLSHATT